MEYRTNLPLLITAHVVTVAAKLIPDMTLSRATKNDHWLSLCMLARARSILSSDQLNQC